MPELQIDPSPDPTNRCRVVAAEFDARGRLNLDVARGELTVNVRFTRRARQLSSECSGCRSTSCVHRDAALRAILRHDELRAWANHESGTRADSAADDQDDSIAPDDEQVAAAQLQKWLERLQRAATPTDSATVTTNPNAKATLVAIYQCTAAADHESIDVSVCVGTQRRDGTTSLQRVLDLRDPPRAAEQKLGTDLELVAKLRRTRGTYGGAARLTDRDTDLFLRIVATGRAYIGSRIDEPLQLGAPRKAVLNWHLTQAGRLAPRVTDQTDSKIVWLDPPIYLDENAKVAGPIDLEVPVALARAFAKGPALEPAVAQGAMAKFDEQLATLQLPTPQPIEIEVRKAAAPRAVLHLATATLENPYTYQPLALDFAQLLFVYGEQRVPPTALEDEIRSVHGNRLVRWPRHRDFEAAAATMLDESELRRLSELPSRDWSTLARSLPNVSTNHAWGQPGDDAYAKQVWEQFLSNTAPRLRAAGMEIEFHSSFRFNVLTAEVLFGSISDAGEGWFDLSVGVEVGGERIELLPLLLETLKSNRDQVPYEIQHGADSHVRVALPDSRTVALPRVRLATILRALAEMQVGSTVEAGKLRLRAASAAQALDLGESLDSLDWQKAGQWRELAQKLRHFDKIEPVEAPAGLAAELRPYQLEGLAWLQFLRAHGLAGILADDMGLGKTVQTLAHILTERRAGRLDRPCLVVTPTSVVHNWVSEAQKFTPMLKVLLLHGTKRGAAFAEIGNVDLVLTTYPLVHRDLAALTAHSFHLVILDEAQAIKNARAKVAKALREIDTRHRLCVTGTPLENNLGELWAQMDFLMPGLLGDAATFGRVFRSPIEKQGDEDRRAALARRMRPLLLRRTKQKVAKELPAKTEVTHAIELAGAQRDLYETIRLSVHERVREEIAKHGIERAQIVILDALLKLRQVCCDPRLVKLDVAKAVPDSAKLEALMEMLDGLLAEGRRVLLFSQFTSMLELIEAELNARGTRYVKLTGETKNRKAVIGKFQTGDVPLFLLSLKAGGTGLNLTAADTVVHYDPWWNPAAEQQATDRAHRIGQDKPVFVYKLIAAGTVEEKIASLQDRKRALAAGILDDGQRQGLALTKDDVDALFSA